MLTSTPPTPPGVPQPPAGWVRSAATADDVSALLDLLVRHETAARGSSGAARGEVEADVVGTGSVSRRHQVLRDGAGDVRGWATAWDRAAGRVIVSVVVDPALDRATADLAGGALYAAVADDAARVARERGLTSTQLDAGAFAGDERQHAWLAAAGYRHVRTWWQMRRPVHPGGTDPGEADPGPSDGVVVRLVEQEAPGARPSEDDLRAVHDVVEEAFTDHFNYHEESFDEFVERQRENSGHRWDHWWLAELVDGDGARPAGALVGEVSPGGAGPDGAPRPDGSYVSYLGVLRSARGRGVAKALLSAVIADAAARGRDRVGLEVDADSPTGAHALYLSTGFATAYVTQSWHRDLPVG